LGGFHKDRSGDPMANEIDEYSEQYLSRSPKIARKKPVRKNVKIVVAATNMSIIALLVEIWLLAQINTVTAVLIFFPFMVLSAGCIGTFAVETYYVTGRR
jgi:glucose-6-phosphate-specific signal transduction histidine kinase